MKASGSVAPELSTGYSGHRWLGKAVWALDAWLRRCHRVSEYSGRPDCVFRIQVAQSPVELTLSDGTRLRPGDYIIDLHMWNEQFPQMSVSGPTLGWGRRVSQSIDLSLRELARHLAAHRELGEVRAIRAHMGLAPGSRQQQFARIMTRYGFETLVLPDSGALAARINRFGENVLISLMVLARNPAAFRPDSLRRGRISAYLSRRCLERHYPAGGGGPDRSSSAGAGSDQISDSGKPPAEAR
jgi:hypothetical protein